MNRHVEAVVAHVRALTGWLSIKENRGDLYRLLVFTSPILVSVGWLTESQAAQFVGYVQVVLGTGLAAGNTPSRRVVPGPRRRGR